MFLTRMLADKRRYRQYRAAVHELPESHRAAVTALERYFHTAGMISDGQVVLTMLDDLLDLFRSAAAAGSSVHDVVGDDPIEFAEAFLGNYDEGRWIVKERTRLLAAIRAAT
ncbi:DUF1048 domain-containing protein [Aeromicrobium marinum]|nr:DUF1048 domain-containing protein [Aeromicrobium marinum]